MKVKVTEQKTSYHSLSVYLEVITRLFSYRPVYQAQALITSPGTAAGSYRPRA